MTTFAALTALLGDVETIVEFFRMRLLLKRYRPEHRVAEGQVPPEVTTCEREFTLLAMRAVTATEAGEVLDAVTWAEVCADFSEKWMEVCHWVSPKKFREHLTQVVGVQWKNEDAVPPHRETPPVELKWYKTPHGSEAAKPCTCALCNIVCNSLAQYNAHIQGRVHKANLREQQRAHGSARLNARKVGAPAAFRPAVNAKGFDAAQPAALPHVAVMGSTLRFGDGMPLANASFGMDAPPELLDTMSAFP